ncbi:MAG: HAD family hydrolase [Chloroflexi bacterium]|nr:HAD family hydrolase [Chloroflexota bacterium]
MAFEAVIFDCDGVLVDSEPIANRVFAEALTDIGLPTTYEQAVDDFMGLSMTACLQKVAQRLGTAMPQDFLADLTERTYKAFKNELQPVAGIVDALEEISLPMCVASSGEVSKMRFTLGLTGLLPRFDGRLFSATQVARGKPHPDIFLHAAKGIGASPERCVVVEDSVPGVRGGVSASMAVLGFAGGLTPAAELTKAGATVFFDMAELPGLLQSGF